MTSCRAEEVIMKQTDRPKIVNVDDNEIGRYAITKMIQRAGFEVIEAATGSDTLRLAHERPDLILLDVNLPDLDGFEVCRRLKSDPTTKSIPILHLSATYNDSTSKVIALEGGADGYLAQPVEAPVLIAHIKALLRSSSLEKQLAKINRSLKAVLQCNQALLQSQSESEVLQEVCRILVEVTGYRFVSIDQFDQATGTTLNPLARWGVNETFHELFNMSFGEKSLSAFLNEAFKTGSPLAIQDVATDPRCEPWRREVLNRCPASALFLPLRWESNLWGVITILSDIPAFLDDEELAPFFGLAYDLSLRLGNLKARKQVIEAQQTLKQSEERYKAVFDNAGLGIDLLDKDGRIVQVNQALVNMLGYSQQEFGQLTFANITHPEDRELSLHHLQALTTGEARSYGIEKRYVKKDGATVWGYLSATAVRGPDEECTGVVGVIADITDRKMMENALRESEEKYRLLFENSKDGVVINDAESMEFLDANPSVQSLWGYSLSELMTLTPVDISLEPESTIAVLQEAIEPGGGTHVPLRSLKRKDGSPVSVEISVSQPFIWNNRRVLCSIVRDVSDRLRADREKEELKSQLLQSQKMEAVGTLAAGIAHDFNNMLQVILGYAEMLLGEKNQGEPGYAELEKILNQACEARDLVQKIRIFSRKADIEPVPVDLNHQLAELIKLLSHTFLKTIDIEMRLGDSLEIIRADPALMDQMVTNLAINAGEAMPDGGTLTIETHNTLVDDDFCKSHVGIKPGPHIVLIMSDTGKGMSEELREKIFDPFFSTKQRDYHKGTGLGLSIVAGIVDEHGGHITVESELGKGSTFKIYFPTLQTQGLLKREVKIDSPTTGAETILLVEDEEFVRELGERLLERFGYRVISVADGQEALEAYTKEQDKISLVILDIVMPRMSGKDCLQELLKINPAVKVIVSSGVAQGDRVREVVDLGAKGSLLKPYGMKALQEKIREVLESE